VSVGPLEIVIVLALALLVFGPNRLPQAGRSLGRAVREFRKATESARSELGLDEVIDEFKGVKDGLASELQSSGLSEVMGDLKAATTIPLSAAGVAKAAATSVVSPSAASPRVDRPVPLAVPAAEAPWPLAGAPAADEPAVVAAAPAPAAAAPAAAAPASETPAADEPAPKAAASGEPADA